MLRIELKVTDNSAFAAINGLSGRTGDLRPALKECFQILRTSVLRNFEVGGRPSRWKRSHRAEAEGGKTLVDTGGLRDSIAWAAPRLEPHRLVFGTKKVYAAVHQFGAPKGSLGVGRRKPKTGVGGPMKRFSTREGLFPIPWGTIPPRPFMVIQPADRRAIRRAILDYVTAR